MSTLSLYYDGGESGTWSRVCAGRSFHSLLFYFIFALSWYGVTYPGYPGV